MDCIGILTQKQIALLPVTKQAQEFYRDIWMSADPRKIFLEARRLGAVEIPDICDIRADVLVIIEEQIARIMQKMVAINDKRFLSFLAKFDDATFHDDVIKPLVPFFFNALAKKHNANFGLDDYHCFICQQPQKIIHKSFITTRLNDPMLNAANEIEKFLGSGTAADYTIERLVFHDFAFLWQCYFAKKDSDKYCAEIQFWLRKIPGMQFYIDNAVLIKDRFNIVLLV